MLYHGYLVTPPAQPVPNMLCYTRCFGDIGAERQEVFVKESWFSLSDDFYLSSISERDSAGRCLKRLEAMNLDGFRIKLETIFGDQEFLNIFTLITLQLNHLAHLTVIDDRAIASELLLDDLEDLLLVELFRKALDSCQGLTTIALLDPNMDVVLRLLSLASVFVGLREGVEGFEVLDS